MAMTLRTDDTLNAALTALSELEGVSRQEIIRRAVIERLEASRHRSVVEAATAEMLGEWGDVLHRLGTV